jgi:hypothetical protein
MKTTEDVESYLDRLAADGATYEEVEEGLYVVRPGGELDFDLVVHCSGNTVILRIKVMDLPAGEAERPGLFRRLLELNASDLVYGSYGIEDESIVLTETLPLSHLDFEEFQGAYESMVFALTQHLRELGSTREVR